MASLLASSQANVRVIQYQSSRITLFCHLVGSIVPYNTEGAIGQYMMEP
jgi:hypothetical protein